MAQQGAQGTGTQGCLLLQWNLLDLGGSRGLHGLRPRISGGGGLSRAQDFPWTAGQGPAAPGEGGSRLCAGFPVASGGGKGAVSLSLLWSGRPWPTLDRKWGQCSGAQSLTAEDERQHPPCPPPAPPGSGGQQPQEGHEEEPGGPLSPPQSLER